MSKKIVVPKDVTGRFAYVTKKCKECGTEFTGFRTRKYCDEHTGIYKSSAARRKRYLKQKGIEDCLVGIQNESIVMFKHSFKTPRLITFKCQLAGCNTAYVCKVLPLRYEYPAWCSDHRSEHKRNLFFAKQDKK